MEIAGKVCIVTGAAQGLGRAFAKSLIERGAKVCLSDINVVKGKESCDALRKEFATTNANFVKCDVSQSEDLIAVFADTQKRYGNVDIVVNNAGVVNERNWSTCVDINLKGVIQGTQLAIDHMSKNRGGVIINVASLAGLTSIFGSPVYAATKHGVVGLTKSWADHPEVRKAGIRLACLCPAFTNTPILNMQIDQLTQWTPAKYFQAFVKDVGVQTVEMVTHGFLQLVQDEGSNGAIMTVSADKGISVKYPKHARL